MSKPIVQLARAGFRLVVRFAIALAITLVGVAPAVWAQPTESHPEIELFFQVALPDDDEAQTALRQIETAWRPGYATMLYELMRLMAPPQPSPPRTPPVGRPGEPRRLEHPTTRVWRRLAAFLEERTGLGVDGADLSNVQQWIWDQPYEPHPDYAVFKGLWYGQIDAGFREFFSAETSSTIRLDEVDWGGVRVNGIPPLEYPDHVRFDAAGAGYLADDNIVFGVATNGEFRAYPKRILAWHEMALDRLGGVELTIVYCTLCGTVIPYESIVEGQHIVFGTSGLLYRSNKLMFDHETKSLWNTFEGVPVAGSLVGSGIRLTHRSVVTTTWGEWKRLHPQTTVLTLDTGHDRDYSEGAAYREYFATDRLMFRVPRLDARLANKDEVVVMLLEDAHGERQPLAISADYLADTPLLHRRHAGRGLLVVTSDRGANRVFDVGDRRFGTEIDGGRLADESGEIWLVREDGLARESDPADRLPRVAAQRAFWFAWFAQFPDTVLIK